MIDKEMEKVVNVYNILLNNLWKYYVVIKFHNRAH